MMTRLAASSIFVLFLSCSVVTFADDQPANPVGDTAGVPLMVGVGPNDWPQWGGSSVKNNTPLCSNVPTDWEIGGFARNADGTLGAWKKEAAENIKWVATLGSQTYGNPVVANGKIFIGTNNQNGYIERYPPEVDLCCLIAFREKDGAFLWQHSNTKLKTGRVHDWPKQGICDSPLVEGDRLWYVTNRGEVVCLDAEGFHDGENDGPFRDEESTDTKEADVIWVYDFMDELNVSQHNMCSCSVTAYGDVLFVMTCNGTDESHEKIPSPEAPSFFAIDKNTAEVYWTDNTPLHNVVHGQWSSPAVGVIDGVPQVIFAGGDGWVYGFKANKGKNGKGELLWKFDCNPKTSKWVLEGAGTRNNIISTPVIQNKRVYIAVGQDPHHGEGLGHFWCIDATKRGDISPTLGVMADDHAKIVPPRRLQSVDPEKGETEIPNPNSGAVWHFDKYDRNGDGEFEHNEMMHRSIGTATIRDGILYQADLSGVLHAMDADTGVVYWTYDMMANVWGSPMVTDKHVYLGDEDGDLAIFPHTKDPNKAVTGEDEFSMEPATAHLDMFNSVLTTPIVANGVLYIANNTHLFAIQANEE
jgi:outer membrane protein assembly factor BamB